MINWKTIEEQFSNIASLVEEFEIPTDQDIESVKLYILSYGQIPSLYFEKLKCGEAIFINTDEAYKKRLHEDLIDVAVNLKFLPEDKHFIPEHLRQPIPDYRQIIIDGIERRDVSTEFLEALAQFHLLAGRYLHLISFNEAREDSFNQMISGIRQSTVLQECWYAHWVHANAPSLKQNDRHECENELADLCFGIARGKIKPRKPYPADWYKKMLVEKEEKREKPLKPIKRLKRELKSTYTKLTQKEIHEMLSDKLIPAEALPPVSSEEFMRIKI